MSVFSLQTKKHLVGWSLAAGLFLSKMVDFLTTETCTDKFLVQDMMDGCPFSSRYGFPFTKIVGGWVGDMNGLFYLNFIFWIFVSVVILSLIRHLRTKKV